MALLIPPGYGQLTARITLTGDAEPMVCTVGVGGVDTEADAEDLVDAFALLWSAEIMDVVASAYQFRGAELRYRTLGMATSDDPLIALSPTYSTVGGHAQEPVPQNSAYLIHKRTALAGRKHRGRMYLPGVGEPNVNAAGVVVGDFLATIPAKFALLLSGIAAVGAGKFLCVLHTDDPAALDTPDPTPITSFTLDAMVATQRRRLRR